MEQNDLVGKSGKVFIDYDDQRLVFSIKKILSLDDKFISFVDRYNDTFIFKLSDIKELQIK